MTGRTWHRFWLKYLSGDTRCVPNWESCWELPMIFVVSNWRPQNRGKGSDVSNSQNQRGWFTMSRLKLNIFDEHTKAMGCLSAGTRLPFSFREFFVLWHQVVVFVSVSLASASFFGFFCILWTWYLKQNFRTFAWVPRIWQNLSKFPRPSTHIPFQWISYGTVDGWDWNLKSILPGIRYNHLVYQCMTVPSIFAALYC